MGEQGYVLYMCCMYRVLRMLWCVVPPCGSTTR